MFGHNPIRSQEHDPTHLAVEESFYTIQGEGPQSGRPAVFIRLAGCNLACHFCDTQFETQAENRVRVDHFIESVVERFTEQQRSFVVLTGGEPLRQNIMLLLAYLFRRGTKLVQIETAGTLWVTGLESFIREGRVQLVCSPKTPRLNVEVIRHCRHWKYIVRAGEAGIDGLPRRGTQLATKDKLSAVWRPFHMNPEDHTVWLSPCDEQDPAKNKENMEAARDLCLQYGYRLSLQTHKIIGVA